MPAIVQTVRARSSAYWSQLRAEEDERTRALLSKYQSGGAVLSLEEVDHEGVAWIALACDLTDVPDHRREHAFAQMQKHARTLQRALELEAATRP